MLNYPNISKDNCYLMLRYDGCILDAKDFDTDIQVPKFDFEVIEFCVGPVKTEFFYWCSL